jgi:glycerol-3-phosphate dehydrogenase
VVLPLRPNGPRGHLYATALKDNRPFFILPWDNRLLVGTTDAPFQGNPDELEVKPWEVEYLLAETNRLFPDCDYSEADIQHTTIGVRPLPISDHAAGAKTRRHFLVDHQRAQGVAGIASVVGGKLTTYRSLAEEVVDWCGATLGAPVPHSAAEALLREPPAASNPADRLTRLYGPKSVEVTALMERRPDLARPLAPGCPSTAAEAVYALTAERARTAEDVLQRRLMLLPSKPEWRHALAELGMAEGLPIAAMLVT